MAGLLHETGTCHGGWSSRNIAGEGVLHDHTVLQLIVIIDAGQVDCIGMRTGLHHFGLGHDGFVVALLVLVLLPWAEIVRRVWSAVRCQSGRYGH